MSAKMAGYARQIIFSSDFSCIFEKKVLILRRETNILYNYPYQYVFLCNVAARHTTAG
jgi:hypothetical protein